MCVVTIPMAVSLGFGILLLTVITLIIDIPDVLQSSNLKNGIKRGLKFGG